MPLYSKSSLDHLNGAHKDFKKIFEFVIKHWDNSITDGRRTELEQIKNIAKGVSKTMDSKHLARNELGLRDEKNGTAWAIDSNPYPIDWNAIQRGMNALKNVDPTGATAEIYMYSGFVQGVAAMMGIKIRAGADWDNDRDIADQSFHDLPHFEKVL